MTRFPWGKIIDKFSYDLDGKFLGVTKYHPWEQKGSESTKKPDYTQIFYHCEALHESFKSIQTLVIAWIVRDNLGLNQQALVAGVAKALNITI